MGELTLREKAFVEAYCGPAYGNGLEAATLAGYSAKSRGSLKVQASRLIRKPRVREAIHELVAARVEGGEAAASADDGGHVFIVRAVGLNRYRIGFTPGDPEARLKHLQESSPVALELVCSWPSHRETAEALCREFAGKRVLFAWFELDRRELRRVEARASASTGGPTPRFGTTRSPRTRTTQHASAAFNKGSSTNSAGD